jgi:hypothetical protein
VATTQAREHPARVRPAGIALTLAGAALVLLSIVRLNWYAADNGVDSAGSSFGYHELYHNVEQLGGLPIARAYFTWLAPLLLMAVAMLGVMSNLVSPLSDWLRFVGCLAGATGTAATYYAVDQLFHAQRLAGGSGSVWHNSTVGLWAALIGFLLAGTGAYLGPHRVRQK